MAGIGLSIDLQGAQIAASLLGVSSLLASEMADAMTDIETMLVDDAQANMHWKGGTGDLEDSILTDSSSTTWSAKVGSALPYTQRRERGFSQMTDSLGRFYAYDPGQFFLEDALASDEEAIQARIESAVQHMFFGIAASA